MKAVTHLEKVIAGETSAVTHLEKVIAQETTAVTYTEKVIAGTAPPVTHLQKVIAGEARPVTHLEYVWAGGSPPPEREYTGAVPVTFVADGTPLLDYIISGNTVQSGTPTPDSPVMPQGTGERTGNLATSVNLTAINNIYIHTNKSEMVSNTPYSVSFYSDDSFKGNSIYLTAYNPSYSRIIGTISGSGWVSSAFSLTDSDVSAIGNASQYLIRIFKQGTDFSETKNIMLNLGSTPLPYEPYGYKIPISSANTTTPVYLGEVETTRKIKKLVFDGTENWFLSTAQAGRFGLSLSDYLKSNGTITSFCSHYMAIAQKSGDTVPNNSQYFYSGSDAARYIFIVDERYTTAADFKTYLAAQYAAGTPVTVWYVLANEETAVVNEPLMKIGDYADTLSMEQAGAQIPTANGSTTLDVETTVKPSEVYIKYKGV